MIEGLFIAAVIVILGWWMYLYITPNRGTNKRWKTTFLDDIGSIDFD